MSKLDLKSSLKLISTFKSINFPATLESSFGTECENSFLQETSFNSDIDIEIRQEIESKFRKSKTNTNYVFPREMATGSYKKLNSKSANKSSLRPKSVLRNASRLTVEKPLKSMSRSNISSELSTNRSNMHTVSLKKL